MCTADFINRLYSRVEKCGKRIILPEAGEVRVLRAADVILKRDICIPVLLGDRNAILNTAKREGFDLSRAEVVDLKGAENFDKYTELYCEIRKHKKVKKEDAKKLISQNPVFYAALAVHSKDADGFVAGASTTTRDVAKAAIYCIGPADSIPTVSSSTILILPHKDLGAEGVFVYADAGIIPDPSAEQLCDIARASVRMARLLFDNEPPRVAMLSYSTKGSGGSGKSIQKVQEATKLIIEKEPGLLIDGEIQVDCAVVPEVAARKDPEGKIAGRANIFIFPNLDAGNIAYKLTERLAKAYAIGPVLQGLKRPASDLSRGCDYQAIVNAVAVTALRSMGSEN